MSPATAPSCRSTRRRLASPPGSGANLQSGEAVSWNGGTATPEQVLGPPRPGLAVGFVTDTRPVPAFPPFLHGVDLLVCEGTYGDPADQPKAVTNGHMTFAEAAAIARDASAKALWLTHFSPALTDPAAYLAEATSIFPETTIGTSGLTTTLSFADEETPPRQTKNDEESKEDSA